MCGGHNHRYLNAADQWSLHVFSSMLNIQINVILIAEFPDIICLLLCCLILDPTLILICLIANSVTLTFDKQLLTYVLSKYLVDVLWGQPIKLIQVAFNSELRENQWNDLLFLEIVPFFWSKTFILNFLSSQFLRLLRPRSNEREQFLTKEVRSIDFHTILN